MKTLLLLSTILAANLTFACPNLSGKFLCNDEEFGSYEQTITQTGSGDNTVYTTYNDLDGSETIVANGKWKEADINGQKLKTKATCVGKVLNVQMELDTGSEVMEALNMVQLDGNNNIYNYTTVLFRNSGQSMSYKETCKRL